LSNANKTRRVQTRTLREEQIAGTFRNFLMSAYLNIFEVSSVSARSIHVDRSISSTSYIKSCISPFRPFFQQDTGCCKNEPSHATDSV